MQAQALLMLSIPNYPLSCQGKSLDNTLVSTLLTVLIAPYICWALNVDWNVVTRMHQRKLERQGF